MTRAVLLDTHILLWLRTAPDRLSERERRAIVAAPCRYVSAVSLWEIALLIGLDRIENDSRFFVVPEGFDLLPITANHCHMLTGLPWHHRDPFDRMLIAQARTDSLLLLTRDSKIIAYGRDGAATANLAQ